MALIKNNAKIAAQIAVELAKIQKRNDGSKDDGIFATSSEFQLSSKAPLVIGGSIVDVHYRVDEDCLKVS